MFLVAFYFRKRKYEHLHINIYVKHTCIYVCPQRMFTYTYETYMFTYIPIQVYILILPNILCMFPHAYMRQIMSVYIRTYICIHTNICLIYNESLHIYIWDIYVCINTNKCINTNICLICVHTNTCIHTNMCVVYNECLHIQNMRHICLHTCQ